MGKVVAWKRFMVENQISQFKRRLEVDPDNLDLKLTLLHALARTHGPHVYRSLLEDRLLWNRASEDCQDRVIEDVAASLEDTFSWLETRFYSCNNIGHRIATFVHKKTGMEFCLIPGGTYIPGTKDLDKEIAFCESTGMNWPRYLYELELQKAPVICRPLMVGRFPVLQKEWDSIGRSIPPKERDPYFPVVGHNWTEVKQWLLKMGDHFRLPREAEWEYACRGGSKTRYFWGDFPEEKYRLGDEKSGKIDGNPFNHLDNNNAFGLLDMVGTVYQWCEDVWVEPPQSNIVKLSLKKGMFRVIRGGCWYDFPATARSAHRDELGYGLHSPSQGFRVFRDV